jgi:tetratricopeptide (TPR) repeat protein
MDEALKQLLALGRDFYDSKQYGRAEKYLSQVIERHQGFADVYNMLGVIYHDQGQFNRALRAFEAALRINPRYTEAALNLAVAYNDLGQYDEAKSVYQDAMRRVEAVSADGDLSPMVKSKLANLYAQVGDVLTSCARPVEAVTEYDRALTLRPDYLDIRMKRANALRDNGQLVEALAELEAVLERNPAFVAARVQYGLVLYGAGRREDAVRVWEEALAHSPGNRSVEMYLKLVKDVSEKGRSA